MKIFRFKSDNKDYDGKYSTGVLYIPGGYEFYSTIEELFNDLSFSRIQNIEYSQHQEEFNKFLNNKRTFNVCYGPGEHRFIEVLTY